VIGREAPYKVDVLLALETARKEVLAPSAGWPGRGAARHQRVM